MITIATDATELRSASRVRTVAIAESWGAENFREFSVLFDKLTEWLIVCALEHIGATFKVKWLLEKFLCAFVKW